MKELLVVGPTVALGSSITLILNGGAFPLKDHVCNMGMVQGLALLLINR